MSDELPPPDPNLQNVALAFTQWCVRNTVIEDYHAAGKLSDAEMKAFNIEVANKLFTALSIMVDPRFKGDQEAFNDFLAYIFPYNWNRPVFDEGMWNSLRHPFEPRAPKKKFSHSGDNPTRP